MSNENANKGVEIDGARLTGQKCYLVATGIICLVRSEISSGTWLVTIWTVGNLQHFGLSWNMLLVCSVRITSIVPLKVDYVGFVSIAMLVGQNNFASEFFKIDDVSPDVTLSAIVRAIMSLFSNVSSFPVFNSCDGPLWHGVWYQLHARRQTEIPTILIDSSRVFQLRRHVQDLANRVFIPSNGKPGSF